MKKQLTLLILNIPLLIILSSARIESAAESITVVELSSINREASIQLWEAAKDGDLKSARKALSQGADINIEFNDENTPDAPLALPLSTPLYTAAFHGHIDMVKFLLERGASTETSLNNTPLVTMCGRLELPRPTVRAIVAELIAHKANVNAQHFYFKSTPLWWAIHVLKDESIVRQLILAGADVWKADKNGKTPTQNIKTPTVRTAVVDAMAEYYQRTHIHPQADAPVQHEQKQTDQVQIDELAQACAWTGAQTPSPEKKPSDYAIIPWDH